MIKSELIKFLANELNCSETSIYNKISSDAGKIVALCIDIITQEASLDDNASPEHNPARESLAEQTMCELAQLGKSSVKIAV